MCLSSFLATCPRCGKAVETITVKGLALARATSRRAGMEEAAVLTEGWCLPDGPVGAVMKGLAADIRAAAEKVGTAPKAAPSASRTSKERL